MSIIRPNNDEVAGHWFSKEGASHADNKQYLLSSKGNREDIPLPKTCGNFNGVDNKIELLNEITLSSDFVISYYFLGGAGKIIIGQINTATNYIYHIDSISFRIIFNNIVYTFSLNNPIDFNVWNSAAWIKTNDNTILLYINGIKQNTEFIGVTDPFLFQIIGGWHTSSFIFTGKIYDVRVHNKELTTQEIQDVLNFKPSGAEIGQWNLEESAGNTAYDSLGNGNHGSILGDLTNFWYQGDDVPYNYANKLGYGRGRWFNNIAGLTYFVSEEGDFILEVEFYLTDTVQARVINQNGTQSGNRIAINSNTNVAVTFNSISINGTLLSDVKNRWINLKVIRVGANIEIYENDNLIGSGINSNPFVHNKIGDRGVNNTTGFIGGIRKYIINDNEVDLIKLDIGAQVGGHRPSINSTTDALGNPLTNPGEVRQLAKVINVNVGVLDGISSIQFAPFVVGFTFTFEGTATSVAIDGTGLLTAGAGDIYDLRILDGGTLVNHYSFNEGQGDIVYDLVGSNNGTWIGHTDPNQWGKSDDAIDYLLIENKQIVFYDGDYRANDSLLTAGSTFESHTTYIAGVGYEVEVLIGSIKAIFAITPWNFEVGSSFYADIELSYIEGASNPIEMSINENLNIDNIILSDGLNQTIRFYNNSVTVSESVYLYISLNATDTSGKLTIHKITHGVTTIKKQQKGFIDSGSNIDFNPYGALGEGVDRDYEYDGLVNADANMYLNQTHRLPSLTDFLIYNNPFVDADSVRRTYAYIGETLGGMILTDVEGVALDKYIKNERSIGNG